MSLEQGDHGALDQGAGGKSDKNWDQIPMYFKIDQSGLADGLEMAYEGKQRIGTQILDFFLRFN